MKLQFSMGQELDWKFCQTEETVSKLRNELDLAIISGTIESCLRQRKVFLNCGCFEIYHDVVCRELFRLSLSAERGQCTAGFMLDLTACAILIDSFRYQRVLFQFS